MTVEDVNSRFFGLEVWGAEAVAVGGRPISRMINEQPDIEGPEPRCIGFGTSVERTQGSLKQSSVC